MWLMGVLVLLSVGATVWLRRAVLLSEAQRLQQMMMGVQCDVTGPEGLSVILAEGCSEEQIEQLLMVEYPRYEVVAVVDGEVQGELLRRLRSRYQLIAVAYRPTGDFPTCGVPALYRSRRRCFRRLVVLDVARARLVARMNVAADVAAYDYLLPLGAEVCLWKERVGWLVEEMRCREAHVARLTCALGASVSLYVRWRVSEAGGFAHRRRLSWRVLPAAVAKSYNPRLQGYAGRMFGVLVAGMVVGLMLLGRWYEGGVVGVTAGTWWLVGIRLRQVGCGEV